MKTNPAGLSLLRARVRAAPITQERLAIAVGMNPAAFSRVLRGLRPIPKSMPDFAERVEAAIHRAETAETAAEEARQRVLAEEE